MVESKKAAEVVVCGLATVDIVARPVNLDQAVGPGNLVSIDQIEATTGGIVSNSGIALSRLGIRTAAIACVGRDAWADLVRRRYQAEAVDSQALITCDSDSTSATVVLVDPNGQRSFLFCRGAAPQLSIEHVLRHRHLYAGASWMLLGYFSLFPEFDARLPEIVEQVRKAGCKTALDCAGAGGKADSLRPIMPHLDLYVPSYDEAVCQTGRSEPRAILQQFRDWGARQIVGLKLGAQGALLSPAPDEFIEVAAVRPPRPVIDTTGAGDAFYAGLIAGLVRGKCLAEAGKIGAATGAACVTGLGASAGLMAWRETCRLAGVPEE